ncbi:tetratricopeptide repeat protein [Silvibacterium sp.]|uniref:tetratricopeptide repeat protein n=1 Tax=Silvibacterium sp. TaxID=1964179 RepID=UPI0039E260C8
MPGLLKEISSLRFGQFTLDRRLRELRRNGELLLVPGKAFDLLSYMAANPGRPLSKSELLDAVWPETTVEESNLSQNVFLLRKVLGSSGDGPIKTLAGRGYQFAAEVIPVETDPDPSLSGVSYSSLASVTVEATETRVVVREDVEESVLPIRQIVFWAAAVLALAALAIAGWLWRQRWLDGSEGAAVKVVIVPMEGTTGDPWLDKSLVQALRMDVAQSPYVSVVPASTVSVTLTQMMHKPDDAITAEIAREICERTDSQGVLSGNIARLGQHFLVTEEASSCVDGAVLGQAKFEAVRAEDLPHAIDTVAASLRRSLGESRRSIARFSMPLFHENTPSLEALKAFTQGTQLIREGKVPEAISLLKTAVAADPKFATAQYNLAVAYATAGDDLHVRDAIAKAYALKDTAMKPTQFGIVAMYDSVYTGDMYDMVRSYQSWVALYPNSSQAWSGLANAQRGLGMFAEALASQQRTVELLPHEQGMLANLVLDQMINGDLKGAHSTLERALHDNLDGDGIRVRYLLLAYMLHDPAMLQAQQVWLASHPDATAVLGIESQIAMAEGRFSDARRLLGRIRDQYRQQGLFGQDDEATKLGAVDLMQSGDMEAGRALFRQSPIDPEEGQEVLGLAVLGDSQDALSAMHASEVKYPRSTMTQLFWGPRVRAAIAMAQHRPADAVRLLEMIPRPLGETALPVPWSRGTAYLASAQPADAEKDFRWVVDHQGIDASSPYIPLSWLGLGEALAAQGKKQDAIAAYRQFFTLWAHADPDATYLKQARQEFAVLSSETAK